MSYIGKEPVIGNFSVADAITTSSTATYALTVGSVAFTPESVNHCIVSLNGVIQAPTSAFTISGTNIVFNSALTSADVIDFIYFLGHVNDIGTPSDNTVSQAKLVNESVNEAKMQISNAGSNGQFLSKQSGNTGGLTWAAAGGDLSFGGDTFGENKVIGANDAYSLSLETSGNAAIIIDANGIVSMPLTCSFSAYPNTTQSNITVGSQQDLQFNAEIWDLNADFNTTTYTFTAPITGKYLFTMSFGLSAYDTACTEYAARLATSNRTYEFRNEDGRMYAQDGFKTWTGSIVAEMDAADTALCRILQSTGTAQTDLIGGQTRTWFTGRLLD